MDFFQYYIYWISLGRNREIGRGQKEKRQRQPAFDFIENVIYILLEYYINDRYSIL